ncbi:endonuclease/exonuclease/phosphatase family metal-dependent hydrolase [Nitrosomonas sp. Nm84]|uniref:endonuclease/exonuclease/phosphatase family protein n=1 Tax=Nitrosomonas sp. Nm84 TaxID=200124 RepID=UPI000D7590AD|nr:endonuclease/exonuclease/phosphatase family protein [Nitrosomonas sp. Nm84]PXW89690.1 endonuclease/exonuclease/phosphatase family metal-dependent hydrolase [Nitrosomonas sp. Nm84]
MKLLSWNIQWGRGMDGRVDLSRILQTIRQLGDFDVICLQEVAVNFSGLPDSKGEDQMAELSAGLPGYTPIYGVATDVPARRGGRSLFGNAIFTRFPVGQVWRHLLPWQAELAVPSMQRMLVEAVITTDIGAVRVMTTHLEYYSQRQREIQIDAIRRLHGEVWAMSQRKFLTEEQGGTFEVFPRPAEAFLCGDLNFPATATERAQILAPFGGDGTPSFQDAWSVLHPATPHTPTVGIHPVDFVDQPECFDFIFITDGLVHHLKAYGIDVATKASDHQPVWVELG